MFMAYMDSKCHAKTNIKLADIMDRTSKFWIMKFVKVAKEQARPPRVKKPIILMNQVAHTSLQEYDISLLREVFSMVYHLCSCIASNGQSQHKILAQNISIHEKQVTVAFTSFKHHNGNIQKVRVLQVTNAEVCPAKMLQRYAQCRRVHRQVPYLCGGQVSK